MPFTRALLSCIAVVVLAGCGAPKFTVDFNKLTDDFVYGNLALSPAAATQSGQPIDRQWFFEALQVSFAQQFSDDCTAGSAQCRLADHGFVGTCLLFQSGGNTWSVKVPGLLDIEIEGVIRVFLAADFVTVTRADDKASEAAMEDRKKAGYF